MLPSVSKNAKVLALFAIVLTAIVGLVSEATKGRIAAQEQAQLLKVLHSIIPPKLHNNDIYQDCKIIVDPLLGKEKQTAYLAKYNDKPIAVALTATAPDGYNGNINLIVAINVNGSISGVRVLKHQETPGLGDKVEIRKSPWINSFSGKPLPDENDSQWAVNKDGGMFDQFTGATITPRAVVKAVKKVALYFKAHQKTLFNAGESCRPQVDELTPENVESEND